MNYKVTDGTMDLMPNVAHFTLEEIRVNQNMMVRFHFDSLIDLIVFKSSNK